MHHRNQCSFVYVCTGIVGVFANGTNESMMNYIQFLAVFKRPAAIEKKMSNPFAGGKHKQWTHFMMIHRYRIKCKLSSSFVRVWEYFFQNELHFHNLCAHDPGLCFSWCSKKNKKIVRHQFEKISNHELRRAHEITEINFFLNHSNSTTKFIPRTMTKMVDQQWITINETLLLIMVCICAMREKSSS